MQTTTTSHSNRLCEKIDLAMPAVQSITNEVLSHPQLRELFPEFLLRVHWLIRFSSPLMTSAKAECERRADSDEVSAAMIPYLEEHLLEEDGHDELLLQDLESIGYPREDILRRLPDPSVASAQGAMHYWTVHHHPVAMFGSLVPSECYQTSMEAIDFLQKRSGYPRSAFRTIELHSELDKEHGEEALKFLDSLPLNEWHHEVLRVAALNFLAGTTQMYRELLDQFPVD